MQKQGPSLHVVPQDPVPRNSKGEDRSKKRSKWSTGKIRGLSYPIDRALHIYQLRKFLNFQYYKFKHVSRGQFHPLMENRDYFMSQALFDEHPGSRRLLKFLVNVVCVSYSSSCQCCLIIDGSIRNTSGAHCASKPYNGVIRARNALKYGDCIVNTLSGYGGRLGWFRYHRNM